MTDRGPTGEPAAPASTRCAVSAVEPLTDDAVAITFDVPAELRRRRTRYAAGQHLDVVARRAATRCGAATRSARRPARRRAAGRGQAARRAARSPRYAPTRLRAGRRARRDDARPAASHRALDPAHAQALRARSPPAAASRRCCRSSRPCSSVEPRQPLHAALRQPDAARSVMFLEELEDLKDRYPDRLQLRARAVPRGAGGRAARPAGSTRDRLRAAARQRWCRRTTSTSGSSAGRTRWWSSARDAAARPRGRAARTSTPSCSTSTATPPPRPRPPRQRHAAPAAQRGHGACSTAAARTVRAARPDGARAGRGAARCAPTRRSPARAACAAPAGPSCVEGEVDDGPQLRARGRRGRRAATCSPASRIRPRDKVVARLRRLTRWRDFQRRRRGGRQLWVEQPRARCARRRWREPRRAGRCRGLRPAGRAAEVESGQVTAPTSAVTVTTAT